MSLLAGVCLLLQLISFDVNSYSILDYLFTFNMTSLDRVRVGQPAPDFDCKAVVDGRIKGRLDDIE